MKKKDRGTSGNNGFFARLISRGRNLYGYITDGVWNDTSNSWKVNVLKTANLSVRSFLNADLQMRAGYLTYQTLLAIVPALALVFAIGRGFGFQNILQSQLFNSFPAQREALSKAFGFVDSYLAQSSEGLFLGVGILFLLWTLISLISSIEDCFNKIWSVKTGRTLWRKLTDYTAIVLILPILMICSSGILVFMSSTVEKFFPSGFFTPILKWSLDFLSIVLVWLFFAGSYLLIPNTKVKFRSAIIAGIMAGTAYSMLQWLFLTGQIYVTRYNAIYGSFAFLPLLLIWLQLVWVITLAGGVICFSSQNINEFSFTDEVSRISENYRWRLTVAVMAVAVQRFNREEAPMTPHEIALEYGMPVTLVSATANKLIEAGLLQRVIVGQNEDEPAVCPSIDPSKITLGTMFERLGAVGTTNFIPDFDQRFSALGEAVLSLRKECIGAASKIFLSDLTVSKS